MGHRQHKTAITEKGEAGGEAPVCLIFLPRRFPHGRDQSSGLLKRSEFEGPDSWYGLNCASTPNNSHVEAVTPMSQNVTVFGDRAFEDMSRASLVAQGLRIRLPMQGHGFNPWSGKIPHAAEQLSPCATTTESAL